MRYQHINLDALFGNIFDNLIGEPIKPHKVALFYLIRILYQIHFGYRCAPSMSPFSNLRHTKLLCYLYGLSTSNKDISYEDFRRLVRHLDKTIRRGIYYPFIIEMEKLARGEHISFQLQDAILSGTRETHYKVQYRQPTKSLRFFTSKSVIGLWVKRLRGQYARSEQAELLELSQEMQEWLLPRDSSELIPISSFRPATPLPVEIDCSVRARNWIFKQMNFIQTCPNIAMPPLECINWCKIIEKRHPDVYNVFLLETILFMQNRDPSAAEKALKMFFDMSMLALTENLALATQSHVIATPTNRPMFYGPLLLGRLRRIFGDRQMSMNLFAESIQQAQIQQDYICNRIAQVELAALTTFGAGPILPHILEFTDQAAIEEETAASRERRAVQSNIHQAARMNEKLEPMDLPFDTDEFNELRVQLIAASKLMAAIADVASCKSPSYAKIYLESAMRHSTGRDLDGKSRMIRDSAAAFITSMRLRQGMVQETRQLANAVLIRNLGDGEILRHETEAQAIAGVNTAYTYCASGDHKTALQVIASLETTFPDNLNWQCARHVRICRNIVEFERAFIDEDYAKCEQTTDDLVFLAPAEALLRRVLICSMKGDLLTAEAMLREFDPTDPMIKARVGMMLGNVLTAQGRFDEARLQLKTTSEGDAAMTHANIRAMITRRAATIEMADGRNEGAVLKLMECEFDIESSCSAVEQCLFNLSVAINLRKINNELEELVRKQHEYTDGSKPKFYYRKVPPQAGQPNPMKYLAKARVLAIKCNWKNVEKIIMAQAASHFHEMSDMENRNKAADAFVQLEDSTKSSLPWTLI